MGYKVKKLPLSLFVCPVVALPWLLPLVTRHHDHQLLHPLPPEPLVTSRLHHEFDKKNITSFLSRRNPAAARAVSAICHAEADFEKCSTKTGLPFVNRKKSLAVI